MISLIAGYYEGLGRKLRFYYICIIKSYWILADLGNIDRV